MYVDGQDNANQSPCALTRIFVVAGSSRRDAWKREFPKLGRFGPQGPESFSLAPVIVVAQLEGAC